METSIFTGIIPWLTPHLILIAGVILAALWNLFFPKHKQVTPLASLVCLLGAAAAYIGHLELTKSQPILGQMYTGDPLSTAIGLISCLVGVVVVLMSMGYERKFGPNKGEYYAILLTATLSVLFLAGTTDLVMLFVSLETLTICCVLLSGMCKRELKSNEAALKYLLSTAATTATFMYGLTFLYGLTGSTDYVNIASKFYQVAQSPSLVAMMLMVLLISVIGFKLSIVPFHMWTPDVYEGAPTPVTAFLSVGSKLGGLVVALRLLTVIFGSASANWVPLIGILAVASMVAGNLIALCQRSVKRMLAYSSIAHVGYFLIALCANTNESFGAIIFYIVVYGLMNLGAFTAAIMIENEVGSDDMDDWSGLIRKRPFVTLSLAVCLLNLGGLPVPPAGFLAKFFVFWSGIQMYSTLGYVLVAVGLITSIPAVFYYTRVAIKMIVAEPSARVNALPERRMALADSQLGPILALTLSLAGIIAAGTNMVTPLMEFSNKAVAGLHQSSTIGQLPSNQTR